MEPGIERTFTLELQDIIQSQTNLNLVSQGGELLYEGEIVDYRISPMTATADQRAAQNRLSISVLVRFYNRNKEEDNFLEVRRTYKDRNGKVYANSFNQNDLVVVEISIRTKNGLSVPNVAITDLLPAGFEIENARLIEIPQIDWIKNAAQPDYKDVRDDRMNLIVTASPRMSKKYLASLDQSTTSTKFSLYLFNGTLVDQ